MCLFHRKRCFRIPRGKELQRGYNVPSRRMFRWIFPTVIAQKLRQGRQHTGKRRLRRASIAAKALKKPMHLMSSSLTQIRRQGFGRSRNPRFPNSCSESLRSHRQPRRAYRRSEDEDGKNRKQATELRYSRVLTVIRARERERAGRGQGSDG